MRALARWLGLLLCALALVGSAPVARADSLDDQVRQIAKQLQCPICESVSVADSPSELAGQMRALIRKKLEAGESEQQILDSFVAAYGDGVLTEPPRRGLSLLVWIGPVIGLAFGAAIVWLVLRAWRRAGSAEAEPSGVSRNGAADGVAVTASLDGTLGTGADDEYLRRAMGELERARRGLGG
ncbi:MAG: cytochrome c-type biogenesis protein CcmH [Chloroflexi bacterium]|nr:cytochrome c-type biogenesis protein CcmH [Chloroflexota bacterium]